MDCNHKKVIIVPHYISYKNDPKPDDDKGYTWGYIHTIEDAKCTQCGKPVS